MKSSSALFPVSLYRAERYPEFDEDVYRIKHNRGPDKSTEIAITHLSRKDDSGLKKIPVIMLHGSFTNRGFWLSHKGTGLARYLLDEGYDVWLYEAPGHGFSPRNKDYKRNTMENYVLHDMPAVQAFVEEKTQQHAHWIGHSLGGVTIASAVAAGLLNKDNTQTVVLLGTQILRTPWYLWIPFAGLLMRTCISMTGELQGRTLKIGPEAEPAGLINEYLARHGWFGSWKLVSTKQRLMPAWQLADVPLLSIAAKADTSDPESYCRRFFKRYGRKHENSDLIEKEYACLSKKQGYSKDYGHVDMVVSKEAEMDVWPKISQWLKEKTQVVQTSDE